MRRRTPTIRSARWIVAASALACGSSCQRDPGQRGRLPDPRAARRAVEAALAEWRAAPPTDPTTPSRRPVMFVDQQRRPGRRLRDSAVLGESNDWPTLGVEVELQLVDADSMALKSAISDVAAGLPAEVRPRRRRSRSSRAWSAGSSSSAG